MFAGDVVHFREGDGEFLVEADHFGVGFVTDGDAHAGDHDGTDFDHILGHAGENFVGLGVGRVGVHWYTGRGVGLKFGVGDGIKGVGQHKGPVGAGQGQAGFFFVGQGAAERLAVCYFHIAVKVFGDVDVVGGSCFVNEVAGPLVVGGFESVGGLVHVLDFFGIVFGLFVGGFGDCAAWGVVWVLHCFAPFLDVIEKD